MRVEIVFTATGSATIELPDELVTEAVTALTPGPDEEPDAFEVWDWLCSNRRGWVVNNARGRALLEAADFDVPTANDIEQENPEGLLPDSFYAREGS